jgi:hypothetical protein
VVDDTAALAEIASLAAGGRGRAAVSIVARRLAESEDIPAKSIARRLRLKRKQQVFSLA